MTFTDCFGQTCANMAEFKAPRMVASFTLQDERGRYLGALFYMEGLKVGHVWTHSLQNHASEPFATEEQAKADFFDTKQALPTAVHQQIFGTP